MANTVGTPTVVRGVNQFQGAFNEMWEVTVTITDQDAVAINDTVRFSLTVPGVALGDMVIGQSITNDLSDGTDQCIMSCYVTAANTVVIQVQADVGQYAADDLNNAVVKMLIGRPAW
jgi:hypothetical protein